MKNVIQIIIACVFIISCRKPPLGVENVYRIYIRNNSNIKVSDLIVNTYPDTTIPDEYDKTGIILVGETIMHNSKRPWKDVINDLPADTISIILFNPDTIAHYGWETIRNQHKVLKRWDVDAAYLEARNWTLTYPE